ncbi:kinesin motor domain-containing protein, partial [Cystoisospora suis]
REDGHLHGWEVSPDSTRIYPVADCELRCDVGGRSVAKSAYISRSSYRFDRCFDDRAFGHDVIVPVPVTTADVFEWVAKPLIDPLLKGKVSDQSVRSQSKKEPLAFCNASGLPGPQRCSESQGVSRFCAATAGVNGSVLTYGQTGSGKTHSVFGTDKDAGLIELAAREIFSQIRFQKKGSSRSHTIPGVAKGTPGNTAQGRPERPATIFTVKVSYLEIYMERVHDLLQAGSDSDSRLPRNLPVKEDPCKGFYVQGLREQQVGTVADVMHLLQQAEQRRRFAKTDFNAMSSRSHVIFSIIVESLTPTGAHLTKAKNEAAGIRKIARLSLVDLAGSERLAFSRAHYSSVRSACQPDKHARSTLGGNAKVALLVTLHPSHRYADLTHNSLKFAQRVGCLRVNAHANYYTTREQSVILRQKEIIQQ